MGGGGEAMGFAAGTGEPENGGVGGLGGGDVFAGGLAEFLGGLGHIEDVVDDLKSEAERLAEVGERGEARGRGMGAHGTEADAGGQERGGFAAVDVLQSRAAEFLAFALEVGDLAADEPLAAAGAGEFADERGGGVARRRRGLCEDGKRDGEQRVAGEDGHAFTEDLVRSGPTAAKVVVVHAGEVVVDERVGVDALDRAGGGCGCGDRAAAGFGSREREDGAKAFAAGEERVAHRLVDGLRLHAGAREEAVERAVDERGTSGEVGGEVHEG